MFPVNVVTPLGPVAQVDVDAVIAPGALGEFEVLKGHVPFVTELHAGVLRLGHGNHEGNVFAVSKGFLEVEPGGGVQVLAEQAVSRGDIDVESVQKEITESADRLKAWQGEIDAPYQTLIDGLAFARAQLLAAQTKAA